nr:hypothetical protein [Tanacetum cinerariifolium]
MVTYLNKSDASDGFNQVIDFLNASYIKYALTINPHIYVSCIKQFWNIVIVKQTNDVTRLQALVEKKKVVITKATIRDALCLDDAEGVNCLPNKEIFAELARMGYEKPSTKLTLYKAFFSSQWKPIYSISYSTYFTTTKTLRSSINITGAPYSTTIPSATTQSPPQAQPQAANFPMSLLQEALDACVALTRRVEHFEYDKVAQALKITKLKRRRIDTSDDTVMEDASNQGRMIDALDSNTGVSLMDDKEDEKKAEEAKVAGDDQVQRRQAEIYKIDMDHSSKVLSMQEDELKVQEVVDVVTTAKLITKVVTAASELVTAASRTIAAAELQVPAATITDAPVKVATASTIRRKGVVITLILKRNQLQSDLLKSSPRTRAKE